MHGLCSRVLKGRYFPTTDFMHATVPRNASATWRAIVAGRGALEAGLLRRIGDGSSVRIWEDRWLPERLSLRPTEQVGSAMLYTVADLIDNESWSWRADLVRNNFIPPDGDAILNIPLRHGGGDDFWAWAHERSGSYTVKSAYRALMTRNEQLALEEGTITESSENNKQVWTRLWKLKVLPKVRVFWWRVLRGILPVEMTLQHRHIATLARCKVCKGMDEDILHALIKCSHAQSFWAEARSWLHLKLPDLHPGTWCKDILCDPHFTEADRAKIVTVMWAIWTSRNSITHDRVSMDPVQSMKRIRETLALLELPLEQIKTLPGYGWRPPEVDWVKINTDASVSVIENKSGIGGLARSPASFVAAWSKPYPDVTDPLIAEALALRDGVIFAKLRGFSRVVMETDCLEMVQLWHSRRFSRSIVAPLLLEIDELALSFLSFDIQHVIRSANLPAHLCAKHASTLGVTDCWMDSPPGFLMTSVMADRVGAIVVE